MSWTKIFFEFMLYIIYTHICRSATRGEGGRSSLSFFENRKKCPDFGKKTLKTLYPSIHLWICLSIYLSWVGFFLWKLCPPFVFPYQKSENLVLPFIEKDITKPMNIPNLLKDYSMFHRKIVCKVISYQQKSI